MTRSRRFDATRQRWKARGRRAFEFLGREYKRLVRPDEFVNMSAVPVVDPAMEARSIDASMYQGCFYETDGYRLLPCDRIASVTTMFPGYSVDRPVQDCDGQEGFCNEAASSNGQWALSHPRGAPVRETVIHQALIFADHLYTPEGGRLHALYETMRANDRAHLPIVRRRHLRSVERVPSGHYVFLGSAGSFNYGHWLTDDLTRVPEPRPDGATTYLISRHWPLIDQRRVDALRMVLPGRRFQVRFIDPAWPLLVGELRYVSPASYHPILKSPDAICHLRDQVGTALKPSHAKRVFIGRGASAPRSILNFDEVERIITSLGFTLLDPVAAGVEEQMATCAGADVILGVMGAAMTNSLFAKPGTHVVHLAPAGWQEPYYWDLAAVCGHRYHVLYGEALDEPGVTNWNRSFRVDANALSALLGRCLERPPSGPDGSA